MVWVSLFAVFILVVSLLQGFKDGAIKHFFNLVALFLAVFLTGLTYQMASGLLSLLPGENWENFLGFFITFGILSATLQLTFLLPRKLFKLIWNQGLGYRLLGGGLSVVNAGINLVLFALVLSAFPVFDWLKLCVAGSGVMSSLVQVFGFIQVLLPEEFLAPANVTLVVDPPLKLIPVVMSALS